jgi:hypothetical protein
MVNESIQGVTEFAFQLWKLIVTKLIVISQHSFLQSISFHFNFLQVFNMAASDYAADIQTIF